MKAILIFGILMFLLAVVNLPVSSAPYSAPTAYEVIAAVNALRASHGMAPYQVDSLLMLAAQGQADYLASMSSSGAMDGHTGAGGTNADQRAINIGFPYVEGLDINENWASLPMHVTVEELIYHVWGDATHMHTMLHPRGQLVGVGVSISAENVYYVLDVAAYWGDAGLTPQPTNAAYGGNIATQQFISQYIAPVIKAEPLSDGSIVHTVQSGQSLWMLAHHYQVTIDSLRQLNGLGSSDMIYIGQKITIRGPQPATPTSIPSTSASPAAAASIIQTPLLANSQHSTRTEDSGSGGGMDAGMAFLLFFGLFALGLILIMLGTSAENSGD